jgi:concentrative nucleoside transporter, CNT family
MFVVMTGGMAGIAGTVFVLYATILASAIPDAAGHIVVASVLGAPAAILISLILVPDPQRARTGAKLGDVEQAATSTMDAIVKGTGAGLELLLNIVAMLIVFIALVYLANSILGLLPDFAGGPLTLQRALGWVMAPVCWLMGVPWLQAVTAGGLMRIKTILNELVAARLLRCKRPVVHRLIIQVVMRGAKRRSNPRRLAPKDWIASLRSQ